MFFNFAIYFHCKFVIFFFYNYRSIDLTKTDIWTTASKTFSTVRQKNNTKTQIDDI